LRPENTCKIFISSFCQLLLGGGEGAIRVLKVSDGISFGSFDDGLVEETGIPVALNRPILFVALFMVSFILGQDDLMLVFKIFLEADILLVGRAHLQAVYLIFNDLKLVRSFRFAFAPSLKIFGKVMGRCE
jgi:hypothetical protein